MVIDPVCRMEIDEEDLRTLHMSYGGKTYYFCTPLCYVRFEIDPEHFLRQGADRDDAARETPGGMSGRRSASGDADGPGDGVPARSRKGVTP